MAERISSPIDGRPRSPVRRVRFDQGRSSAGRDRIAAEALLEVRLEGQPFSGIMRTPGADEDLAAGFLFSEGVVFESGDIQRIDVGKSPNVIDASFAPRRAAIVPELLSQRRQVVMNSSCGMCRGAPSSR